MLLFLSNMDYILQGTDGITFKMVMENDIEPVYLLFKGDWFDLLGTRGSVQTLFLTMICKN